MIPRLRVVQTANGMCLGSEVEVIKVEDIELFVPREKKVLIE